MTDRATPGPTADVHLAERRLAELEADAQQSVPRSAHRREGFTQTRAEAWLRFFTASQG
ncbi:hypothetical protein [Streptomyces sp. HC307]|uniref:hypothetical protein n=1 Tax=Streptomyces flavusporus TaxID=3385496 RepID=UPI0039170484